MTADDGPPIQAAPDWHTSELPVRNAAAVVLYDETRAVLIARRSPTLDEFPGVWSFPSVYERVGAPLWESLAQMLGGELNLAVTAGRLVFRRGGLRPRWRIVMHLFEAYRASGPAVVGSKYDAVRW